MLGIIHRNRVNILVNAQCYEHVFDSLHIYKCGDIYLINLFILLGPLRAIHAHTCTSHKVVAEGRLDNLTQITDGDPKLELIPETDITLNSYVLHAI